jgi:large subunit ribosomal protein L17
MRHRISRRQLGRTASHRKALMHNQVMDLLRHDRIVTTEAKAKELRPIAERVITLGKRGDSVARRRARAILSDNNVVRRLFDELAPRFTDRPGGYTRITKLGPRLGDGARMAQIELVEGGGGTIMASATAESAAASQAVPVASDEPAIDAETGAEDEAPGASPDSGELDDASAPVDEDPGGEDAGTEDEKEGDA